MCAFGLVLEVQFAKRRKERVSSALFISIRIQLSINTIINKAAAVPLQPEFCPTEIVESQGSTFCGEAEERQASQVIR